MIKIVDSLTSPANASYLENLFLDQPWSYLQSTAYNLESKPYDSSWALSLYNHEQIMHPLMTHCQSLLVKALHENNIPMSKLIRIRAGLTTRTPYPVVHAPHVDWDSPHMTALYYVNDADGDTIFYKEKRDPSLKQSSYEWSKDRKFNIKQSITPKADRMVIFDGSTYHSSTSSCSTDYRIIINFNFLN